MNEYEFIRASTKNPQGLYNHSYQIVRSIEPEFNLV